MKVICIKKSTTISTNGHPIGVEPLHINVGDQFDVNDEYLERDKAIYISNHTDGNHYSIWRDDFITLEEWREYQIDKIISNNGPTK